MGSEKNKPQRSKGRDSNIELLRIIAMLGVIILHYNNASIGGGFKYAEYGSADYYVISTFESIFICAVDLFILISGYFMVNDQKRNLIKPIKLVVQLIIFKLGTYLFYVCVGRSVFSSSLLINSIIPNNYFVILYVVLYLISPYINIVIRSLDSKQQKKMVMILVGVFSIYASVTDIICHFKGVALKGLSPIGFDGNQAGYTIVIFVLMYIIGAYIRLNEDKFKKRKTAGLLVTLLVLVAVDVSWPYLSRLLGSYKSIAYSYHNPVVITMAIVAFLIFFRMDIGEKPIINKLAKGGFSVYLLHQVFFNYLNIQHYAKGNMFILIAHIVLSAVVIYLLCWAIGCVYSFITDPVFKFIENRIGKGEYSVKTKEDDQ